MESLVKETLVMAAKNGYKAYEVEGHDTFGFLITPDDNILTVNRGIWGGISFSFDYVPSREHGQGCSCCDDTIWECDIDMLKTLEAEGKAFALKLGAKLYSSSKEWYDSCYWNGRGLKEIAA